LPTPRPPLITVGMPALIHAVKPLKNQRQFLCGNALRRYP